MATYEDIEYAAARWDVLFPKFQEMIGALIDLKIPGTTLTPHPTHPQVEIKFLGRSSDLVFRLKKADEQFIGYVDMAKLIGFGKWSDPVFICTIDQHGNVYLDNHGQNGKSYEDVADLKRIATKIISEVMPELKQNEGVKVVR